MKTVMKIEGMACGHCVARVEKALSALDGVKGLEVSLEKGEASFERGNASDDALRDAVESLGFGVKEIK